MSTHQNVSLDTLLIQFATAVRDLCQRQVDKNRLLDHLNLDAVVHGLLCEYGLEPDFDLQLSACIEAMSQPDAMGQTLVFERRHGELHIRGIDIDDLREASIEGYEMMLFDGGNTRGDRWKHVFFPAQRTHHFVHEMA